jgi:hypothetical protein
MVEVQGLESKFTQEGAQFGGKRRKRGKSKTRGTRRRMRGGAPPDPEKLEGNTDVMMGGKSRRKKRKARKGKNSRSSKK